MFSSFLDDTRGNFAVTAALSIIPLLLAVGMSVDYSSAVADKSAMQSALDSATLSLTTLPKTTSDADRQTKLQEAFEANGGSGAATLITPVYDADGTLHLSATASYEMPTNFMKLAMIDNVPISVSTAVTKKPSLVKATFKIDKVSGWWNKTMTLYGTKFGETSAKKLMEISYTYNNGGDVKGYGTTTVYKISGTTKTQVQRQVCTTVQVQNFNNLPAGAITSTDGSGKKRVTTCTMNPVNGGGAEIDVSQMRTLYLQMDVPSGSPKVLKSNDPATSDRLYINDIEIEKGKTVDIFTAVPCGETGTQAWEDGGSAVPAPVINADFFYTVTGQCDYSQRTAETSITQ